MVRISLPDYSTVSCYGSTMFCVPSLDRPRSGEGEDGGADDEPIGNEHVRGMVPEELEQPIDRCPADYEGNDGSHNQRTRHVRLRDHMPLIEQLFQPGRKDRRQAEQKREARGGRPLQSNSKSRGDGG